MYIQVAIPLKSIPMSRYLPEMPAECRTLQIWLPLTTLTLLWHCADFNCLFPWPRWRHREPSDPHDTKSESKIPSTLLTPLLWCGLLRMLSTLTFRSIMEVLPFLMHRAILHSVNPCVSSVIVWALILSIWMIFNYHSYDFLPMNYEVVGAILHQAINIMYHVYHFTNIRQTMFKRSWEVVNPTSSLLSEVRLLTPIPIYEVPISALWVVRHHIALDNLLFILLIVEAHSREIIPVSPYHHYGMPFMDRAWLNQHGIWGILTHWPLGNLNEILYM